MCLTIRASTLVMATIVFTLFAGVTNMHDEASHKIPGSNSESFAVVELFTSQGCSSCPAADRFLSELLKESKALYALSFHVDYWDRLGWRDPYSKAQFTDRQRSYAQAFGASQIYTPQMIINGQEAFVGSQRKQGKGLVEQALAQGTSVNVEQLSLDRKGENILVKGRFFNITSKSMVHFALVERNVVTKVIRGENSGRILRNDNVVRVFKTKEISLAGEIQTPITLPVGINHSKAAVIVYVQEIISMKIVAARSLDLE